MIRRGATLFKNVRAGRLAVAPVRRFAKLREDDGMRRVYDHYDAQDPYEFQTYVPDLPNPMEEKDPLYTHKGVGGLRQYVFNKPLSRNALDLGSVRWLTKRAWMFLREIDMHCVVLRAQTEGSTHGKGREFSVGVDHPVLLTLQENNRDPDKFFSEFYQLCYLISQIPKPFVTVFNGRVSGAASALAVNSLYRIVTCESTFSLPQTGHGFFPDAGLCYFLSRLDGGLGPFLALTGYELQGADLMHARIGTHFLLDKYVHAYMEELELNSGYHDTVHEITERRSDEWEDIPFSLEPHMELVHSAFDLGTTQSVKDIMEKLEKDGSRFADEIASVLREKSPISLEVTLVALKEARVHTLEDSLRAEYQIAKSFRAHPDYAIGVRNVIQSKTSKVEWSSEKVTTLEIKKFFNRERDSVELPIVDYQDPYAFSWKPSEIQRNY